MTTAIEYILIGSSLLLLLSVLASKISDRLGIPALLLFLVLGMLAGSDGPGGIYFDDPALAQLVAVIALALILFSGGLDTRWDSVRPVLKSGVVLSTLGVCITALITGAFAQVLLGLSFLESLLLGAIVSSTDAAAVFSILRSKNISLKGQLKPLLELESGSNDPMAVFLTTTLIQLLMQPATSLASLVLLFGLQMSLGAALGYGMGKSIVFFVNRLKLRHEGLYPVLTLSLVLLTYGLTNVIGGNGFLAVYLTGIIAGNRDFIHKRTLLRFHDGLAWLMQIVMFLTLGLLVFPSRLSSIVGVGLLIASCLMFVARPVSVFISLLPTTTDLREKAFVSWVGLRGAVPIVLATFPLLARTPQADLFFNVVFFVVLTSVLLQGTSVPLVAKWLHVDAPVISKPIYPLEYTPVSGLKSELKELTIPGGSNVDGKAIVELGLPPNFLIILIARNHDFILPSGQTTLQAGDTLLVLTEKEVFHQVQSQIGMPG
ncbi:MAG: potassium/proton antiporter [Candidatus Tectomicrobia bacterium]|nr:potassium/proton antiporter [Candidatus Tectomicrobia bacterium]